MSTAGQQSETDSFPAAISGNGQKVAFESRALNLVPGDTNQHADVYVRDRVAHQTKRFSLTVDGTQPNSECSGPTISADGREVAFVSDASNLVPGDTNDETDVFLRDTEP